MVLNRFHRIIIVFLFYSNLSIAATFTSNGTGGGNWNNLATWNSTVLPGPGDDIIIAVGDIVTVNVNATVLSIHFNGGGSSSSLVLNNGISLIVTGMINIAPPTAGTNDNTLNVADGILSCNTLSTTNSGNNARRCVIQIINGTLTCNTGFFIANNTTRNKLTFAGSGTLQLGSNGNTILNAHFTPATGIIDYNAATNQTILPLNYYSLKCSNNAIKELTANTVLTGDLYIDGSAQLDVGNNFNLTVPGNWSVTSTNPDPFVEKNGTVTFNTSAGTKTLVTTLPVGETFYNLISNHTSTLLTLNNIQVNRQYTHTNGVLDLNGNQFQVISNATANLNCNMNGGLIKSSQPGSIVHFSDGAGDFVYVNFNGTDIGDATIPVDLEINTGRICVAQLDLYGRGTFTKTRNTDDVCTGGNNVYHDEVIFTATSTASRWRMGNGASQPDLFLGKARFNAFANGGSNNNFILGVNSVGNTYADSVILTSTTPGGLFVGRSNGGNNNSHHFLGPVVINVAFTGNVTLAEATAANPATVTIANTLKINSTSSSSGDVYLGTNNAASGFTITPTGQLVNGTITGATNIFLYNIVQLGVLPQTIINNGLTNSQIRIGSNIAPCNFNGPVTFEAPNIDIAYSNFFGSNNIFTMNGNTSNQNCTGGNLFGAASSNTFVNTGSVYWRLANSAGDIYMGDVFYNRVAGGALSPAYNHNCVYEGDIVILNGSAAVDFATGGNGRVTITGNSSKAFTNNGTAITTDIKRITMNKSSGDFTLNHPVSMPANGDLVLTNGKIITSITSPLILLDETCNVPALNSSSASYIDGPMRYDISTTNFQTVHFPIGKGTDCRPVILRLKHSNGTSYSYMAEMHNNSAQALGWTLPSTLTHVSGVRWWDIERTVTSTSVVAPTTHLQGSQTITVFYDVNDGVVTPAFLSIAKNTHTATTSWIDIGGSGATAPTGSVVCTSNPSNFDSFSRFTLANQNGGDNPLPVELISFDAKPENNHVRIDWATAAEINNNYFTVEKSVDAIEFTELVKVPSKNNGYSNSINNYKAFDFLPVTGLNYYRLKQSDFSGKNNYSAITSVFFGNNTELLIYPNPSSKTLYINEILENIYEIFLVNNLGIKIIPSMAEDSDRIKINTSLLNEGVYHLVIDGKQGKIVKKIVVQH